MINAGSVGQLLFGHGTSNGRMVSGPLSKGIGDPNRAVHNEWLRIMYEWGLLGIILWLLFIGSLMQYAYQGLSLDRAGFCKPLFVYLPAFCIGVSGENIIAGAGHAENIGLLLVIGLAAIAYRRAKPADRQPGYDNTFSLAAKGAY
jgi:O-antigen ligase